jgi:hypothetical protein
MSKERHVIFSQSVPHLNPVLQRFFAPFAPLFGRIDTRRRSAQYVQSLLVQHAERRNAENLATAVDHATRVFQRLLSNSPWEH